MECGTKQKNKPDGYNRLIYCFHCAGDEFCEGKDDEKWDRATWG